MELKPDIPIVHYSRTGTTQTVATDLEERLAGAKIHDIEAKKQRSYPNWLARSFIPGSTVDIQPLRTDLSDATAAFVGTPKWTLSCPPVTAFLEKATLEGVSLGLFVTYGGFDEKRYTEALVRRIQEKEADVRATLLVQRDNVGTTEYDESLQTFVDAVLERTDDNQDTEP